MNYVVCDLETTGLDPEKDEIIEVGLVRLEMGSIAGTFHSLVRPGRLLPVKIKRLTGLGDQELCSSPTIDLVLPEVIGFIGDSPVVGHNVSFDAGFLSAALGGCLPNPLYDTRELARFVLPGTSSYRLESLCTFLGIEMPVQHRALDDAVATARLFLVLMEKLNEFDLNVLTQLNDFLSKANSNWAPVMSDLVKKKLSRFPDQKLFFYPFQVMEEPESGKSRTAPGTNEDGTGVELEQEKVLTFMEGISSCLPGYERRPQQEAMAVEVTGALNKGQYLLVEAGTGVGKSMAYLIPAVLWSLLKRQRVMVSTHTINLQEQLWFKDIPLLQQLLNQPFRVALVKGRQNYLCLRRWFSMTDSDFTPEEAALFARILTWLTVTRTGDRSELNLIGQENEWWYLVCADADGCLGSRCRWFQRACFVIRARREAEEADLIITNHSLLFSDLRVENRVLPAYGPLIIDEAHHLEDSATLHLGCQVSRGAFNRWFGMTGKNLVKLAEIVPPAGDLLRWNNTMAEVKEAVALTTEACRTFFTMLTEILIRTSPDNGEGYSKITFRLNPLLLSRISEWAVLSDYYAGLVNYFDNLTGALHKLRELLELWAISEESWEGLAFDLTQVIKAGLQVIEDLGFIFNCRDDGYVYWVETGSLQQESTVLLAAPVAVGDLLYEQLFKNKECIIFTSATLTIDGSFEHYLERTGLSRLSPEKLVSVRLDSPFSYEKQALLCIARDLPLPGAVPEEEYLDALAAALKDLIGAVRGKTMVLFTSHRTLREVYGRLKPALEEMDICLLGHNIDGGRSRLLEEFRTTERTILFGAASFWEGVDIQGESLQCVIIVKLPFWSPGIPVVEARLEELARQDRDGFFSLSLPQAVIRFKQGFGRLIRSRQDRGIVVVLDRRLVEKKYGRHFLNSLPLRSHVRGDTGMISRKVAEWLADIDSEPVSWHIMENAEQVAGYLKRY
jgi:ATP-dependent DNA helicase DinG